MADSMRPDPLTPLDSDLSDFRFMPLEVGRFKRSDLATQEEPEVVVAAILLWCAAWHSQPAASLSNDDRSLAQAAGFGRGVEAFRSIKDKALRGFVECSDGRLYHTVVAEKAREAWEGKLKRLWRTDCSTIRKRNERARERGEAGDEECPTFDAWRANRYVTRDKPAPSRATRGDSHARQEGPVGATTKMSRVTNGSGACDGEGGIQQTSPADERNDLSQATSANVTRDKGLDSRARAPRERDSGEGDSIDDYANAPSSSGDDEFPASPDEAPTEQAEPPRDDAFERMQALGEKAGLNLTRPKTLMDALAQLKEWEGEGISFEATIVPTIERRTRENPSEPIYSLKYFDAAVRKAHALSKDARAIPPLPPAKPRAPIGSSDEADERLATFRRRIAYPLGPRYERTYGTENCILSIDDRLLVMSFRTEAEAWRAEHTDGQLLQSTAQAVGFVAARFKALGS